MVFNGQTPEAFNNYHRDHAELLVRYIFQLTPDEQRRLTSSSPAATSGSPPSPAAQPPPPSTAHARSSAGRAALRLNGHASLRAPVRERSRRARSPGPIRAAHVRRP